MLSISCAKQKGRSRFSSPGVTGDFEWLRPLYSLPIDRSGNPLAFDATTGLITTNVASIALPWTLGSPPGTVRNVASDGQMTTALAALARGDEIVVNAGTTLSVFDLPNISGFDPDNAATWIIIRTSGVASLPALSATGNPVSTGDVSFMFSVVHTSTFDSSPCIRAAASAKGYRIIGAQVTSTKSGNHEDGLIRTSPDSYNDAGRTSFFTIDRCWITRTAGTGARRGISVGSDDTVIHQCRISDIDDASVDDSQGISMWEGISRVRITRNVIEAVSENILGGGVGSSLTTKNPTDIEIRGNYINKKSSWSAITEVKNHIELKKGIRVLIEGNKFVNMWQLAQDQSQIYQSNSQSGLEVAALTKDVTCRFNQFDNIFSFVKLGWKNGTNATEGASRMEISHCLVTSCNLGIDNSNVTFMPDVNCNDSTFRYNTTPNTHSLFYMSGGVIPLGSTNWGVRCENNISYDVTTYGIFGAGSGNETDLNIAYLNSGNWSVKRNVLLPAINTPLSAGLKATPHFNSEAANAAAIGFTNLAGGDFSLAGGSAYKGTSMDGKDPGVYWPLLQTLLSGINP